MSNIKTTLCLGLLLHFEDGVLMNGDMKVNQLSADDLSGWQDLFNSKPELEQEPIKAECPIEPSPEVPTEPEVVIDIPAEPVAIDPNPEPETKPEVPAEPALEVIFPDEPEAIEPEPEKEVPAESVIIHEDEDGEGYDSNQAYEDYAKQHSSPAEPEVVIVDTVSQPPLSEPDAQDEPVAVTPPDTEETLPEPSDNVDEAPAKPSEETPEPSEVDPSPIVLIDQQPEVVISDEAIAFVADIETPSEEELAYIDANLAAANEPAPKKGTRKRKAKLEDMDYNDII